MEHLQAPAMKRRQELDGGYHLGQTINTGIPLRFTVNHSMYIYIYIDDYSYNVSIDPNIDINIYVGILRKLKFMVFMTFSYLAILRSL